MSDPHSPLRLNVGFIIAQSAGYSRDFTIELPQVSLPPDLVLNNLVGEVRVTRTPQGLLLQADLKAETSLDCVRCLEAFNAPLHVNFTELYAFSKRNVTDSGLLVPEDGQIDLEPLIREYMLLELPISPLCKSDCQGLCPVCGENRNFVNCSHEDEALDPRLEELRKLLDEDETKKDKT